MTEAAGAPTYNDWARLFDEGDVKERRASAEDRYRDLSLDQVSYLRKRAKNDLFFLCSGPLEYELLSTRLHGHLCKWLTRTRGSQYRMELLPRGHYKSTIVTIGEAIQMALPNDAGVPEHPYCLGPDIKILLGHEVRESASRFLFEIAEAFTAKPLMLALFPECIPSPRKQRINKWELELPRNTHNREPTFDTIGAGGAAQGRHYNWLKLDDLIGEDARDSETIMKRVLDWFDNANSLLTRAKIDGKDLIGTRWAASDVYSHAVKRYGVDKDVSVLGCYFKDDIERMEDGLLAVYGRGALEQGKPLFPEEFSLEFLQVLRKNHKVWAAQYANNPRDSALTEFDPSWLKHYNVGANGRIYVFGGDTSWSVDPGDLDRCILIDPSVGEDGDSDESGILVTGVDKQFNIYILEAIKERLNPPALIDQMFQLYVKWWPRLISVESVAFSAIYKYWFAQKCQEMGVYPSIYDYKPGSRKSKKARIRGLTHYFAAGQVYGLESMMDLKDELEWFPLGDSEHLLDALAQGPEVWYPAKTQTDFKDYAKAEAMVFADRDALTGY